MNFFLVGPTTPTSQTSTLSSAVMGPTTAEQVADLLPFAYEELRTLARELLRRYRAGGPQATSIVHEAYARLAIGDGVPFADAGEFLRTATRAMRFVLVDRLRRETALKRGGRRAREELDSRVCADRRDGPDLLAIDELLTQLAAVDQRKALLVELRFFGGVSFSEAAAALGVSLATAKREWALARAWMFRELGAA